MILCDETILNLNAETIFAIDNPLDDIFQEQDSTERARLLAVYRQQAAKIGVQKEAEKLIKSYEKHALSLTERLYNKSNSDMGIGLELDGFGKPMNTTNNFICVIENDPIITNLRLKYNLLTNAPEKSVEGIAEPWTDNDDATLRWIIEAKYHFHSVQKCEDALRVVFSRNEYHPIIELINGFKWDGKSRIYDFLHEWMKCDDTPYTREVSRLIFAGGINRLYNPGCKFDDMPVLIGTKQGEGKSTIVRWLALEDRFFTEVTEIEGQKGMEAVEGAWICEMGELLALTKAKEVEAVKSFLTRQVDKYRKPYDRRLTEYKRQCIFIGTTNREQFLTDKSGNRRYYPVKVYQSGYELYNHEAECKEYIRQCWAEAKALFDEGKLKAVANYNLITEIREQQKNAVEEDYRIGMIEKFIADKKIVCTRQLYERALNLTGDIPRKMSAEIGQIMDNMDGWRKLDYRPYFEDFGQQRAWGRLTTYNCDDFEEIPE